MLNKRNGLHFVLVFCTIFLVSLFLFPWIKIGSLMDIFSLDLFITCYRVFCLRYLKKVASHFGLFFMIVLP